MNVQELGTSTKLFILCAAFVISLGVPVFALVREKQIAIDFARKELVGSRYLASVRDVYAAVLAAGSRGEHADRPRGSRDAVLAALAEAEADAGAGLQTSELARALTVALRELWAAEGGRTDRGMPDVAPGMRAAGPERSRRRGLSRRPGRRGAQATDG